jgi:hypothetical protein
VGVEPAQVIDTRFGLLKLQQGLKLTQRAEAANALTNLGASGRLGERPAEPAGPTSTVFHVTSLIIVDISTMFKNRVGQASIPAKACAQNQPYKGFYNNGGLGQGLGQGQAQAQAAVDPTTASQQLTAAPTIPGYFGLGSNLRILVSPFLRFNQDTKETDIIMFNSKNLGALIVGEDPHVKSLDESPYSIQNVAIEETYGLRPSADRRALLPRWKITAGRATTGGPRQPLSARPRASVACSPRMGLGCRGWCCSRTVI